MGAVAEGSPGAGLENDGHFFQAEAVEKLRKWKKKTDKPIQTFANVS